MKDVKSVGTSVYPGKLVFVRTVRNINYNIVTGEDEYQYEDKLKAGFIKDKSKYFDDYYLVKFFTGEEAFHWAADLFEKTEEKDLTYLRR